MMLKKITAIAISMTLSLLTTTSLLAQDEIVQEGEFGIGLGAAHYFGDLNTRAQLNRPKMAANIFFRNNQ